MNKAYSDHSYTPAVFGHHNDELAVDAISSAALAGGEPTMDEASATLMSDLAADMVEWTASTWAVAMSRVDGALRPVCVCGTPPDLERCMECASALLRPGSPRLEAGDMARAFCGSGRWIPEILIPVRVAQEVRGAVAFGPKRDAPGYTAADRELMLAGVAQVSSLLATDRLGRLIASRVARMNRIRADLEVARNVQARFLPSRTPEVRGLDYYGECQPAGDVVGDFYDFIPLGQHALAVSIGDVSGKGVSAAIMMSALQTSLRGMTCDGSGDAADVVRTLNRTVCDICPDNFFATLFYAHVDSRSRCLRYVSAGHPAALIVRSEGNRVERLESTGAVLGLTGRSIYTQRSVLLEPGDLLVAFTDGVAEAMDERGGEWRDDGVLAAVRRHPGARASEVVRRIRDAVERFTCHTGQTDDRTVLAVRFKGTAEAGLFKVSAAEFACAAAA